MPQPRVAVDAMGGDHGATVVAKGAVLACRELGVGVSLAGPEAVLRDELEGPGGGRPAHRGARRARRGGHGREGQSLHPEEAFLHPGRPGARAGRKGGGLLLGGEYRRLLGHRPDAARHPGGGGSARAGRGLSEPQGAHRVPRRGRKLPVQGPPPRGVRGHGERLQPGRLPRGLAPGGPHEPGGGGDEGERAHSRRPRGAEGVEPQLRGQRRGARPLHRQGGRGRDGWPHRQRGAQGLRDARGVHDRPHSRGAEARPPEPGRGLAVDAGVPGGPSAERLGRDRRGPASGRQRLLRDRPRQVQQPRDHARHPHRRRVLLERRQRGHRGRAAPPRVRARRRAAHERREDRGAGGQGRARDGSLARHRAGPRRHPR